MKQVAQWATMAHQRATIIYDVQRQVTLNLKQTLKGSQLPSLWLDLAEFQTHPKFYGCPCYGAVTYQRI